MDIFFDRLQACLPYLPENLDQCCGGNNCFFFLLFFFFFSLRPTCFELSHLECLSMVNSHKAVERELKFLITFCSGCKESQLYSLLFRQAVPSMHYPESHFDQPQFFCVYLACTTLKAILTSPNFFMNGIDYSSSESEFSRKLYLPARQVKNAVTSSIIKSSTPGLLPGHYSVYSLCTLFNIIWLELEPLNAF